MEEEDIPPVNIGRLTTDVSTKIFFCLPLKELIRLKLVSRSWNKFITVFRNRRDRFATVYRGLRDPFTTDTGLLVRLLRRDDHNQKGDESFIVIRPNSNGTVFNNQVHSHQLNLSCSCNGLLLYSDREFAYTGMLSLYVRSPFLETCLALPELYAEKIWAGMGIAFNGSGSNFLVVVFFNHQLDRGLLNGKVFSLESRRWRPFQSKIENIGMAIQRDFNGFETLNRCLYSPGRLNWIWSNWMLQYETGNESNWMLQYETGNESFRLLCLPPESSRDSLLYELEGQVCLCYQRGSDLRRFAFVDRGMGEWRPQPALNLQGPCLKSLARRPRVRPCAFNPDLQQLIIIVESTVYSYSLETGQFSPVWTGQRSTDVVVEVLPLLFKPVKWLDKEGDSSFWVRASSFFRDA